MFHDKVQLGQFVEMRERLADIIALVQQLEAMHPDHTLCIQLDLHDRSAPWPTGFHYRWLEKSGKSLPPAHFVLRLISVHWRICTRHQQRARQHHTSPASDVDRKTFAYLETRVPASLLKST